MDAKGNIGNVEVRVSEATRNMSKPAGGEVGTFAQEYEQLRDRKQELESKLSAFHQTAFLKEQCRIRKETGNTFEKWMVRKSEMVQERDRLLSQKREVEKRMIFIKDRAREERIMIQKDPPSILIARAMLAELREIRQILSKMGPSGG